MSIHHPNHKQSDEPGPEPGPQGNAPGDPRSGRRRRRDSEAAYLAVAVELGRLHCVEQEICATVGGDVVGLDVVARGPLIGRVATSRQLLRSIDDEADVIEANGLLVGEAVAALSRARQLWSSAEEGFVAITLDGRFIASESFLTTIKDATREAGLEPRQLVLSVEADLGLAGLWPTLQRLKSHGVRIALEEFRLGTPANDLVSRFPIDVLRVDIGGMGDGEGADPQSELCSIVRLAADLRCQVMAEHFATRDQVELAIEAGCDLIALPPADGLG